MAQPRRENSRQACGHVSVVIEKPDGTVEGPVGFGPVNVGAKKDAVFGGPGTVRDDSGYANAGNGQQVSSKPITLSADEYAKVKGYIDEVKTNPGRYSAPSDGSVEGTRNCIDFAEGALKAAGKTEKAQDLFEEGQLSESLAGSEINRRREQQNNEGKLPNQSQAPMDGDTPQVAQLPGGATGTDEPGDTGSDDPAGNGSAVEPPTETAEPPAQEPPPVQNAPEAPADPQVAAMVEMAAKPVDNPDRATLLKPVDNLTQPEMMDMINHAQGDYRGWRSGDPLKYHTYEKVQDWHAAMYGDGPQQYDGGKPIEPTPIRPIPEQPSPHTTPNGEDLWQATARIGSKVADAAGSDGYANAVTGLPAAQRAEPDHRMARQAPAERLCGALQPHRPP